MSANIIIKTIANANNIDISALSAHSYTNSYHWKRISAAKKLCSYILSFKYTRNQIAIMLHYRNSRKIRSNIQYVKKNINKFDNILIEKLLLNL